MKKIILIFSILFLTGCDINYNLTINNDQITENIDVNAELNSPPITAYIDEQGASETDDLIEGVSYYNIKELNNSTFLDYKFSFNDYYRSTATNTCLKKVSLTKDSQNNYILNTTSYFSCFDLYPSLDNINVNITLNNLYTLVSTNSDNQNNNTYTWHINKKNYQDKNIQLIFQNKTEDIPNNEENTENKKEEETRSKETSIFTYILVITAVTVFLIVIFGYIKYKSIK